MPIMARCNECGKQYRMREEFAGRTVPCKDCGGEFRVPGRKPAAAGGRTAGSAQPARPRPARRDDFFERDDDSAGSSSLIWIIGGASAVAVIAGIVIAIVAFSGGSDEDDKKDENLAKNSGIGELVDPNGNVVPANNRNVVPADNRNVIPVVPPDNRNVARNNPPPRNPGGNPGGLQPPPRNKIPVLGGNDIPPRNGLPGGLIPARNGVAQPDFGKSNPLNWTVQIDPPKEPIAFTVKGKLMLICPKFFFVNAKYPRTNSAFVALGSNSKEKEYRDVWDLRTKKKIGQIGGIKDTFSKNGVLSPDGSYYAIKTRETKNILLWDVRNRKALGYLPLDEEGQKAYSLHLLDFAGPNRIVAAVRRKPLSVWSLPDAKDRKSILLPDTYDATSVTFSHGGRYMTLFHRESGVRVYDLEKGTEAGRISMPGDLGYTRCQGMAFSPDGEELAAIFEFVGKSRFFVWNVKDGKQVVHHAFKIAGKHYAGPGVQWFPDKSKWLVMGDDIIDRKAGGPIWSVPKLPGASYGSVARLLGGERIALFGQTRGIKAIAAVDIPLDQLAKGAKVVGSGGSTEDVGLPPLKLANEAGAFNVPVNGVAGGWSVQPDASKKPAAATLTGAMNIDSSFGRVMGVLLSRRDVAQGLVISHANGRIGRLPAADGKKPLVRLDRYDLSQKKRLDSFSMTFPADLMAYSPSGKRAVVRYKKGEDRVDCLSLDDKKYVIGWKPYKSEKSAFYRKVTAAAFINDDHVLTLNGKNKLVLWKLPECKAVYVMNQVKSPRISPNGKYLAVAVGKQYRLFDGLTGKAAGDISLTGSPLSAEFHPNGERFAVVSSDSSGRKLGTWNLKTGKAEGEFPIPSIATSMHWCGDNHILLDQRRLVDLKNKMIVWNYTAGGVIHSPQSPDGRHWYLSGSNPITLTAAELPDADAKQRLAGRKLAPKLVLKPGMKVGLNIQLNGISGHANLTKEVFDNLSRRFQAQGITIDQKNPPLVLFARAEVKNTGKSKTYVRSSSRFGFGIRPPRIGRIGRPRTGTNPPAGSTSETVSETVIECRIVFGQGGKAYGERTMKISNLLSSFTVKKGTSASEYLSTRQANSAAGFFRGYMPPGFLFDNGAANGLGTSKFVSGGTRTVR